MMKDGIKMITLNLNAIKIRYKNFIKPKLSKRLQAEVKALAKDIVEHLQKDQNSTERTVDNG